MKSIKRVEDVSEKQHLMKYLDIKKCGKFIQIR